jgi:hypothetical protein
MKPILTRTSLPPLLTLSLTLGAVLAASADVCEARSGAVAPTVVELYTSEGCSSCPPADRWLSTLKGRNDVLPLAFHVTYWDRLGWPDRFASAEATKRQYAWANLLGSPNVYTPQVLVNGQDWRRWPALPQAAVKAPVAMTLSRQNHTVTARVEPGPQRLQGYWAVVEDQHLSRVTAGENRGETLRHDHVVRLYRPVTAWPAGAAQTFTLDVLPGEPANPRRVVFVVEDAQSHRPLQALALDC